MSVEQRGDEVPVYARRIPRVGHRGCQKRPVGVAGLECHARPRLHQGGLVTAPDKLISGCNARNTTANYDYVQDFISL